MSVSSEYLEFIIDQLELVDDIRTRKMFGAIGIYSADRFFAIVDDDILYFKVDDGNRSDYEKAGMKPFKPYPDKDETMSYYEIPVEVLEDRHELALWAGKAIAVSERAQKKKRRK
jgi:DNA transformation protein